MQEKSCCTFLPYHYMTARLNEIQFVPFIDARLQAGFPSPANDYLEEAINLHAEIVKHPLSTFIFTSTGDSMTGAFIPPNACLVIDRSIIPKNGDIVLAVLQGEFTVKYYERTEFKCWLAPANNKYKRMEITEEMEMSVWGVVIRILIDPKDVRYVRPS